MAGGSWWVVWNANTGAINVVGPVASAPATPASGKVYGPYATKAQAEAEANPNTSTLGVIGLGLGAGAGKATGGAVGDTQTGSPLSFALSASGLSGWFVRGLKVLLGGILMILAVSRLTGASNKITEIAGNAIPLAAAA